MSVFSVPVLLFGVMLLVWAYLFGTARTRIAQPRFYEQLGLTRRSAVAFFGITGIVMTVGGIGLALPPSAARIRMTLDLVTGGLLVIIFVAWMIYILLGGRRR